MEQNDVQLIQQILQGDQEAFSPLVRKYQKGVHALVWRKIGDFHIAQEITQDAFLTTYKKLGTLKNHTQFSGWLYVIAANLCRDWFRKNRMPVTESLEATAANWELISSEVPNGGIKSIAISNNRLYYGTTFYGMFHISLEEQMDIANSF